MATHQKRSKRLRGAQWGAFRRFLKWPESASINPDGRTIVVLEDSTLVATKIDQRHQFHRVVNCSNCGCEFVWPSEIRHRTDLRQRWLVLCDRCARLS